MDSQELLNRVAENLSVRRALAPPTKRPSFSLSLSRSLPGVVVVVSNV